MKRRDLKGRSVTLAGMVVALLGSPICEAQAQEDLSSTPNLKKLSVEELLDLEVTSVSKRPEKLLDAPASVEVITGEEIRRAGVPSLPEALRLTNNLDVARQNAHQWVISARGFSSDVGNKLLVLSDGRTLYTPLFSGVFWDRQDYILEDIDRIEVISGPGGALWGANAVNGVINITTRRAQDTQGLYLGAAGGSDPRKVADARYGGTLADGVAYRVYGKYSDWGRNELEDGTDAHDAWHAAQGGFRLDAQPSGPDSFTVQGDFYRNEEQIQSGGRSTVSGGNLLGRWSKTLSETAGLSLQTYYDRTHLILPVPPVVFAPAGTFKDDLDTLDLDFQHHFELGQRSRILWGLGYRYTHDVVGNAPGLAFFPATLDQSLFSGFIQDEIALRDDLTWTLGAKVEHNDYTGFEFEPSTRLQWNVTDRQSLWGAVSRAVRSPSRIDREISQPAPEYLIVILEGGQDFRSETVVAYELGYRGQLNSRSSVALSTFYNVYDHLRSTSLSPPDPLFQLPFPFFFENNLKGETWGFELSGDFQPFERWRLHAGYRLLKEDIRIEAGKVDFNNALNETADPEHQASLRSSLDLPGHLELDTNWRWVDNRRINNSGVPALIPSYVDLSLRVGWRPPGRVEYSLAGENLLHDRHPEYGVPGPAQIQIERSVWARIVCRF
jgi:iron complex outermembrane receptor protein